MKKILYLKFVNIKKKFLICFAQILQNMHNV